MRSIVSFFAILMVSALCVFAQPANGAGSGEPKAEFAAEREMAGKAQNAHGGEKLRKMTSLVIRGSVGISFSAQTIPATFVTVFSGDKYRFELNNPFQPIVQVNDGTQASASVGNGITLPPLNRIGFPVLQRIGDFGFIVTALPEEKRKKGGFRVTSPEGVVTDFFIDTKTGMIKGYDSAYEFGGRTGTTSVEIDKYRLVDGVQIPERYVQRFDLGPNTIYADFKAKDILVNSELAADVFTIAPGR